MKKIPTLFVRDLKTHRITDSVVPGCEWVTEGFGNATQKFDGQCCLVVQGVLFKRREVKKGKSEPYGFWEVDRDSTTGKRIGWIETGNGSDDKYFKEAFDGGRDSYGHPFISGATYELLGPEVQGNPEQTTCHVLVPHGSVPSLPTPPRDYYGLAEYFEHKDVEGIVWHHPDGRRAKIKGKDFGIKRTGSGG